jgi:hypothetical protein
MELSSQNSSAQENGQNTNKRKLSNTRKKRSWVWKHFNQSTNSKDIAVCGEPDCAAEVSCIGGTTNFMKGHLKTAHKIVSDKSNETKKIKQEFSQQDLLEIAVYVFRLNYYFPLFFKNHCNELGQNSWLKITSL